MMGAIPDRPPDLTLFGRSVNATLNFDRETKTITYDLQLVFDANFVEIDANSENGIANAMHTCIRAMLDATNGDYITLTGDVPL